MIGYAGVVSSRLIFIIFSLQDILDCNFPELVLLGPVNSNSHHIACIQVTATSVVLARPDENTAGCKFAGFELACS